MVLSCVINAAIAVFVFWAVYGHIRNGALKTVFRYFTTLSNLFCAASSLAVFVARLCGDIPSSILVLKYVSTVAVSVTFLTVMLFLGPVVYNYKDLLSGPDFWLHLVCPVLAIVSLLLWDKPDMPFSAAFLGVLPVLLYGCTYLYQVILAPSEKKWDDFYGFNREGKWPLSFAAMLFSSFLISLVLWKI